MTEQNEPIYPISDSEGICTKIREINNAFEKPAIGLTKREYFSAMAMQGLLSIYNNDEQCNIVPNKSNVEYMAELSVTAADALINALNKQP